MGTAAMAMGAPGTAATAREAPATVVAEEMPEGLHAATSRRSEGMKDELQDAS